MFRRVRRPSDKEYSIRFWDSLRAERYHTETSCSYKRNFVEFSTNDRLPAPAPAACMQYVLLLLAYSDC